MRFKNQRGFSLIEILMVLVLIAVLAAIAINAFINFRQNAQDANIAANVKVLRTGIGVQYAQMQLRCGENAGVFPTLADLNANDITTGGLCTVGDVTIASERQFVQGAIPIPPTGALNVVLACGGAGDCVRGNATPCAAAAAPFSEQWCYNVATGEIWLDSATVDANGTIYETY